jgi:hypothetical protein
LLFIHLFQQERIDITHGDRCERSLSVKQLMEEWPHGRTSVFDGFRGKTSVFSQKVSESGQDTIAGR